MAKSNIIISVGSIFGRLTIIELMPKTKGLSQVKCLCTCKKIFIRSIKGIKDGVRSCGCLNVDSIRAACFKHGGKSGPDRTEYLIWKGMRSRCYSEGSKYYKRYGGRGITMCERWRADFSFFLSDMGKKPFPGASIDRIDNDGPYSPENCRWATKAQQCRNRSTTRFVTFGGKTMAVGDWADAYKIPYRTLIYRVRRGDEICERLFIP